LGNRFGVFSGEDGVFRRGDVRRIFAVTSFPVASFVLFILVFSIFNGFLAKMRRQSNSNVHQDAHSHPMPNTTNANTLIALVPV
jgi:hypothetical protein